MKLCKDCKHYTFKRDVYDFNHLHLCIKFKTEEVDLVTGVKSYIGIINAYVMRENTCGKEAKYWEAK